MKTFADTADLAEIKHLSRTGLLDGVTTNPTLIARAGGDFKQTIVAICEATATPVSAEVGASDYEGMVSQGETLAGLAPNVVVKLPITTDGLRACSFFDAEGIATNLTLCFSLSQALLAARSGATYVSPFVGRLEDRGEDGIDLLRRIRVAFDIYGYTTQILAASIRSVDHVEAAACAGADIVTAPASVLTALLDHPLTSAGLQAFDNDWRSSGQMI